MLLPHGYEGQGPEHSSARLERYLQLSAENNWQVCNLTTPAQYFHALRRQMHRPFRKPLVLMSPKSLLRHKLARVADRRASPTAPSSRCSPRRAALDAARTRRVLLCSGKIYYDLLVGREQRGIDDVAIVRVEQLYPFPAEQIRRALAAVHRRVRGVLGAGGAVEHGRVAVSWPCACRRSSARVARCATSAATKRPARRSARTRCISASSRSWSTARSGSRMAVDVQIPTLGESVTEGVIVRWMKQNGERVAADEPLFELETDKASVEIPAPSAGVITILAQEGATVHVGDVVARIDGAGAAASPAPPPAPPPSSQGAAPSAPAGGGGGTAASPRPAPAVASRCAAAAPAAGSSGAGAVAGGAPPGRGASARSGADSGHAVAADG